MQVSRKRTSQAARAVSRYPEAGECLAWWKHSGGGRCGGSPVSKVRICGHLMGLWLFLRVWWSATGWSELRSAFAGVTVLRTECRGKHGAERLPGGSVGLQGRDAGRAWILKAEPGACLTDGKWGVREREASRMAPRFLAPVTGRKGLARTRGGVDMGVDSNQEFSLGLRGFNTPI